MAGTVGDGYASDVEVVNLSQQDILSSLEFNDHPVDPRLNTPSWKLKFSLCVRVYTWIAIGLIAFWLLFSVMVITNLPYEKPQRLYVGCRGTRYIPESHDTMTFSGISVVPQANAKIGAYLLDATPVLNSIVPVAHNESITLAGGSYYVWRTFFNYGSTVTVSYEASDTIDFLVIGGLEWYDAWKSGLQNAELFSAEESSYSNYFDMERDDDVFFVFKSIAASSQHYTVDVDIRILMTVTRHDLVASAYTEYKGASEVPMSFLSSQAVLLKADQDDFAYADVSFVPRFSWLDLGLLSFLFGLVLIAVLSVPLIVFTFIARERPSLHDVLKHSMKH